MDIQTRKLAFIESFLHINSEDLIERLELMIKDEKAKEYEQNLKPMTIAEYHEMVQRAVEDHEKGRVLSQEELMMNVKGWK